MAGCLALGFSLKEIAAELAKCSGVKGRASISFYAYNVNGNRGVACGLNNLQKLADGTPLGGKARAEDDFATEDVDDFLS